MQMKNPVLGKYPRQPEKQQFPDCPPGKTRYFQHDFGHYALEARILFNRQEEWPSVFSIHGARSDYTSTNVLTFGLQQNDISTLSVNLSGHNASSPLALNNTSLQNNIAEASAFFDYLDCASPITVIAHSLGGAVALNLLKRHAAKIGKLILFCPAVYSKHAYDQSYGDDFRAAIRSPYSYRDNDTIELLEQFAGNMLLIYGQFDGLDPLAYGRPAGTSAGAIVIGNTPCYSPIPKEVVCMLADAVPDERMSLLTIPGCDHALMTWMRADQGRAGQVVERVTAFVKN